MTQKLSVVLLSVFSLLTRDREQSHGRNGWKRMKRKNLAFSVMTVLVVTVTLLSSSGTVFGVPEYLDGAGSFNAAYGTAYNCTLCHQTAGGSPSSPRNSFSSNWTSSTIGARQIPMSAALAAADSDGDGASNAAEFSARTYPGNASSVPATADTTAPTVAISTPATNPVSTGSTPIAFSGTASDNVGVSQISWTNSLGGSGTATGTTSWNTSIALVSGANVITITARDAAGNTATATRTVTYTPPDTTAPTVAISTPATNPVSTGSTPIAFSGTASDAGGITQVSWSNSAGGAGTATGTTSWSASIALASGANTITITARDAAGNTATATRTVNYTPPVPAIDTTPPTVASFTVPPTSTSLTVPITSLVATDNVGVTGVMVTESATPPPASAAGWSASAPANYTFASASVHTLHAWAKDAAGNVSASRSASTSITLTPPPPPPPPPPPATLPTFSNPTQVTNLYFPLANLRRSTLRGTVAQEPVRVERRLRDGRKEFSVGDKTVRTLILEDRTYINWVLKEVALTYLAQADDGGVYVFGETFNTYSNGRVVSREGSWLYGINTDQPGILIPANPQDGTVFEGANVPGITQKKSEVVSVSETVTGRAGTFRNCLQIREVLTDGTVVDSYYAPKVGLVKEVFENGDLSLSSRRRGSRDDDEHDDDEHDDD